MSRVVLGEHTECAQKLEPAQSGGDQNDAAATVAVVTVPGPMVAAATSSPGPRLRNPCETFTDGPRC